MASTRIAFGVAFIAAPGRVAAPWIGPAAHSVGGRVMTRSMGVRDGLLGVGLLQALRSKDLGAAAPWLAAGAGAGVVDAAATLLAWRSLSRSGRGFLAFICTATVVDAVLARAIAEAV